MAQNLEQIKTQKESNDQSIISNRNETEILEDEWLVRIGISYHNNKVASTSICLLCKYALYQTFISF